MSTLTQSTTAADPPVLATRRGKLTLALLCLVAFLDVVDITIVNVALPSIRDDVGFSVQNLQWVASGGLSSLACALAGSEGVLVGARQAQGMGAAMMTPAALSILTTSFPDGPDRRKAIDAA